MNWIELHTDTSASEQLSFLDGPQIVSLCANNGCTAVACTDRNSILSYLPMEQEAAYRGIQLLYGVTLDCADLDDRYAITLLAKNELGRRNIFALMRLLEGNHFPFGRCVTRQQVESHREGLLLGASAIDGQLTRAIQLRRGTRRLQEIAAGYDYLEFPLEPYDTAAQLLQLSKEISAPLCAVRSARLAPNPSEAERHAFQAISYDRGLEERPSPYLPPDEVAEQFRALYVLPGERQGLEQALSQGQAWVMEQIAPLEPLQHLLNQNAEAAEMAPLPVGGSPAAELWGFSGTGHCPAVQLGIGTVGAVGHGGAGPVDAGDCQRDPGGRRTGQHCRPLEQFLPALSPGNHSVEPAANGAGSQWP